MAGGKIYLREKDGLVPMTEARYDAEDVLQRLLADYPDLLAGDQMRPSEPRRWLLITREAGIPDTEGGQPRWSLDHLFIDQDAIPTLVEVKRSSDTRIRREVVGQMLDYAANIVAYWPGPQLRQLFEDRPRPDGASPDAEVIRLLDLPASPEDEASHAVDEYWQRAASNLASRQIRLVFVADVIPPELQRIIEFLNENLVRAEVLAVEVKQYIGEGRQTLVPRVIGRTAAAEDVKQTASSGTRPVRRNWSLDEFRAAISAQGGTDASAFLEAGLVWVQTHGGSSVIGHGKYGPLYFTLPTRDGQQVKVLAIDSGGTVSVNYVFLKDHPPFDDAGERLGINRRLNEIGGVSIPDDMAVRASWPMVRLDAVRAPADRAAFFRVFDDVAARLAAPPSR
jgi:hypothetical protein